MANGWRKGFADVVAAIRATLADAANAGSMSAADFLKLAGLPSSAVPTTRTVGTTAPLTGGGDLSADRTLAISAASGVAAGSMSAADFTKLAGLPSSAVPTTRTVGTTAPLTGGGDLSADRTLGISAATALAAGSLAAADFAKLATVGAGNAICGVGYTQVVDLTTTGTYSIIPATPGRVRAIATVWELKTVGGTRSVAPTLSIGTNSLNYNDFAASQAGSAQLLTQAAETWAGAITQISPAPALDISTNGLVLNVTAGATGAGIVLTARLAIWYALFPV
ncbi:MAG TPA: hypothetical protein VFJ64_10725 [Solirubrobacterales bacterium]|nr:hypothetical protein [Solirubrobacterales bacterium]